MLIQEIVDPLHRGSATASNLFSRNLGSTLGATLFGAVLNFGLSHAKGIGVVTADQLRQVLAVQADPYRQRRGGPARAAAVAAHDLCRLARHFDRDRRIGAGRPTGHARANARGAGELTPQGGRRRATASCKAADVQATPPVT